jgi:uncharacterized protein with beta-barrel porin domain
LGHSEDTCFVLGGPFGGNFIDSFTFNGTTTSSGTSLYVDLFGPDCIAFSPDGSTAYATASSSGGSGTIYTFPTAGPYTTPTSFDTGVPSPYGIAVSADGNTGFLTSNSGLYYFSISGSDHTASLLTPSSTTISNPVIIVLDRSGTAYVNTYPAPGVYQVTLDVTNQTYNATLIPSQTSAVSAGLTVSSDGFLYIARASGGEAGSVYRIPLDNIDADPVLVSTGPPFLDGITVSADGKTLFGAVYANGVYACSTDSLPTTMGITNFTLDNVMLTVGIFSPFSSGLINLGGLTGNNLALAQYINNNAPTSTRTLFASLSGGALTSALESSAPTRNAFITYASQNGFLAASQVVSDHMRQNKFFRKLRDNTSVATADMSVDDFLVDASNAVYKKKGCSPEKSWTGWVTPFGEYAREKAQHQTPSFSMGLGGAVAAMEYNGLASNTIGFAGAYAYTHIHEANGAGTANLNQGYLTLYGTVNAAKWYFDFGAWSGYYHSNNQRQVSVSSVDSVARSSIHGWQLAPHLEIGYDGFLLQDCGVKWFGVEPFVMGDWVANWEHGFKEHGAGSLNMGQKGRFCSFLRSEAGLRLHEVAKFSWGELVFREKGSYVYQKAFHTGQLTSFLIGSPGSFTVTTLTSAQNLGVVEFSMLYISSRANMPYVDIRYQGEFGSQYQSHQGMVEIGKSF